MKTWRASDPDHIPRGRRVLVLADPADAPHLREFVLTVASVSDLPNARVGVIERRWKDGDYMVHLVGTRWHITFGRKQLLYPVPDNVLPFAPPQR